MIHTIIGRVENHDSTPEKMAIKPATPSYET